MQRRVPDLSRSYDWQPRPLLQASHPHKDGPALLLLSALFEEPQGVEHRRDD